MKMKNYLKVLSSVMLLAFLGSCSGKKERRVFQGKAVSWLICRPICLIVAL